MQWRQNPSAFLMKHRKVNREPCSAQMNTARSRCNVGQVCKGGSVGGGVAKGGDKSSRKDYLCGAHDLN